MVRGKAYENGYLGLDWAQDKKIKKMKEMEEKIGGKK